MFKRLAVGLGALVLSFAGLAPAHAAPTGISQKVGVCDPNFPARCMAPNASGAIPITGTITTSLGAFNPTGSATLTTGSTSARVALPSADPTALLRNTGTVDEWITFGNSSVVSTVAGGALLPAGQAVAFNVGSGTYVAGITASAAGSLAVSTGTGLPTMTGGGGSGGGGGAVTIADGASVTLGSKADAATCATTNTLIACARQLHTDVTSPLPAQAGTVIVGGVGIDQTTQGTTNGVVAKAAAVGGATPGVTAALTNTAVAIKASAGTLYKVRCYNPNASAVSVQIYNIASGSVTVGTSTAVDIVTIAATSSGGWRAGAVGDAYSTAISYAATTTPTGSTAPGTALSCAYAFN